MIAYAHTRGVKIGLGLDINDKMPDYKEAIDDPELIAARVKQIAEDYPDLDYLLCFQSEGMGPDAFKIWQRIFDGFYKGMKARSPRTALAVAGWGLAPVSIAKLPPDVICGPISQYSDGCVSGKEYGTREFWGCPWLERDFGSSEYYYPYTMHLFNTVKAWQERAGNMNGFYCLSWRLTDAVEPKMSFMAKAPWDKAGRYTTSRAVYRDYAERNYGAAAADAIAAILDNNEPYVNDYGECCGTPQFFSPPMFKGKPTCDYLFNFLEFTLRRPEGARPPWPRPLIIPAPSPICTSARARRASRTSVPARGSATTTSISAAARPTSRRLSPRRATAAWSKSASMARTAPCWGSATSATAATG